MIMTARRQPLNWTGYCFLSIQSACEISRSEHRITRPCKLIGTSRSSSRPVNAQLPHTSPSSSFAKMLQCGHKIKHLSYLIDRPPTTILHEHPHRFKLNSRSSPAIVQVNERGFPPWTRQKSSLFDGLLWKIIKVNSRSYVSSLTIAKRSLVNHRFSWTHVHRIPPPPKPPSLVVPLPLCLSNSIMSRGKQLNLKLQPAEI